MRAILFHELGGPEVLRLGELPRPEPTPGTILIRNHAIGVNFADTLFRRGLYLTRPKRPDTPGLEAAGTIEALGQGVEGLAVGMRVAAITTKAYADYCLAKASRVIPLPEFVDFERGAAFPIQALTAYHLLHTAHRTEAGQTVLVHSAAGGVGGLAVQMAKAAGARVIGTVSDDGKIGRARDAGADAVINYATQDLAAEALRLTEGRGVDLILDAVGKPTVENGLRCLAPRGHLIFYGRSGGVPDPVNLLRLLGKSLAVSGFVLYHILDVPDDWAAGIERSFALLREGKVRLRIDHTFPLAEAADAHRHMESRQSVGKLVLIP